MQVDGSQDHILSPPGKAPLLLVNSRRGWLRSAALGLGLRASCRHAYGAGRDDSIGTLHTILGQYQSQLDEVRRQNGGSRSLPAVRWFVFGRGNRRKLLYRDGRLSDARTGELLRHWDVVDELIVPPVATILLMLRSGDRVRIVEEEQSLWLTEGPRRETLCAQPVKLPSFAGQSADLVLKTLHHEILVNLVQGRPLPNLFSPTQPRYREATMVAMVLKTTGNLDLIRDWILGLREPFDSAPGGERQADNLGQVLYLVSLVSDRNHPVVNRVLEAIPELRRDNYIVGMTDSAEHPVYQTAWLKFGLRALGLEDPFQVPAVADPYGSLFWIDFRDAIHNQATDLEKATNPAMAWASDHAQNTHTGALGDRDFPLTWGPAEAANIVPGFKLSLPEYEKKKRAAPNSWHAAEMFLRLLK